MPEHLDAPVTFVLDANLGLPVDHAPWSRFLASVGVVAAPSSDMVRIDDALAHHEPDIAYIPAADYHGMSRDPGYRGLAQATSARTGLPEQASLLVVRRDDPATGLDDLAGARLGYVNASCSSSYFAPAILAAERGRRLADHFTLVLTPPWQAQIDAVVSGEVRATTVLEDVWMSSPHNAEHTRIVARVDGLAPPVVIVRSVLDPALAEALLAELQAWTPPSGSVYGPFVPYLDAHVRPFFDVLDGLSRVDGAPTLSRLLAPHAASLGDRAALVHDGRTWSYAELAARTGSLASAMSADGLAGERVALMLPNGPEAVLAYLACFSAGAVATPLNSRYAPPEIESALQRARPRWIVVQADRLDRLGRVDPRVLDGVRILAVGDAEGYESLEPLLHRPSSEPSDPAPDAPAVLFFTSGSTGVPKGVVHSHASALAMLTSTSEALGDVGAADVVQVFEPLVHVSGFIGTLTTLMAGGTVALHEGFDVRRYVAALLEHRPTLVCTHIDVLAQVVRAPDARREWFSSLRGVYTGGDTVPAALQKEFLEVAGLPIAVGWGMTEAIWLTVVREPHFERDGCVGRPVGGVEVRDDEVTGELLVRGPMVMRGYWEDDPLTATTLAGGWLRTGDLGRRDADGVWWFVGRMKDLIVRRTSKITPGEVESALDLHPAVAMSAVVGAPDPEEGEVPVAFVVARPGQAVSAGELTAFLAGRIAAYKIPARIHFRDHLPLTASGKTAHRQLREST